MPALVMNDLIFFNTNGSISSHYFKQNNCPLQFCISYRLLFNFRSHTFWTQEPPLRPNLVFHYISGWMTLLMPTSFGFSFINTLSAHGKGHPTGPGRGALKGSNFPTPSVSRHACWLILAQSAFCSQIYFGQLRMICILI